MADVRPTPEKRPIIGGLARLLQRADEFARKPFGYENPPVEMISNFLSVPQLYRTMENYAYGSPLASGTSSVSRYLPKLTEDTKGAIEGATNLLPLVGPATRATTAGATALGRLGERAAARAVPQIMERRGVGADLLSALSQGTTSNVMKPKGGNWLTGSVEESVLPLRTRVMGEDPVERLKRAEDYFADYTAHGTPLDPAALERERARLAPDIAVNRWINTKLAKYIRNEMGTPEDPVRALAEEGILHYSPTPAHSGSPLEAVVVDKREKAGMPITGMGASRLARGWEDATDFSILAVPSQKRVRDLERSGTVSSQMLMAQNSWMKNLPRGTPVYETDSNVTFNLGFPHLIDELKTAMSPTSDLPMNLRLNPKDIDKLTVPQAVERVSKINAWRAEQAAIAERAGMMANLKAEPRLADESLQLSFVEKPGGAWVDIPDTVNEKGMKLCTSIGKAGGWCTKNEGLARTYGSGENRLTTLLDAEGRPHAQAKITTDADHLAAFEAASDTLTPQQAARWEDYFGARRGPPELEDGIEWIERNAPEAYTVYKRNMTEQNNNSLPDITELKPPGNSFSSDRSKEYIKRDPQYKDKVTNSVLNFLNNGNWGRVSDLHHYDIVDLQEPGSLMDGLKTLYGDESSRRIGQEFIDAFNHAVAAEPNANRFMTPRQLRDFIGPVEPLEGYARGGLVDYDPDEIARLAASVVPGYAAGGLVDYDPTEIDTIASKLKEEFYG